VLACFGSLHCQVAGGEFGSVAGAELGEQRGHMTLDGPHRQVQLLGDGGIGQPGGDEGEGVGFSTADAEVSEGVGNRRG
jgi:hypothetical protein